MDRAPAIFPFPSSEKVASPVKPLFKEVIISNKGKYYIKKGNFYGKIHLGNLKSSLTRLLLF